jgi:hypothetical protein
MDVLKESKDEAKKTEYYLMWMKKAVLSREQARADKENRNVLVNRAISELEELVLEVGEETAIGLRGLFEIAQCREVAGNVGDAIDSYKGAIQQIGTSLEQAQKGELELSGTLQGFLFEMLQEVYVKTGEVMAREGAPGTADLFAEFRKQMTAFGEKGADLFDVVSDQYGLLMLLAEARFQAESGDPKKVGDALAMAQKINDKHPADFVGVRAKAALRDILTFQQNLVSGTLLFEIAKGELQNKHYEAAVKGARRTIAALNKDEEAKLKKEEEKKRKEAESRRKKQEEEDKKKGGGKGKGGEASQNKRGRSAKKASGQAAGPRSQSMGAGPMDTERAQVAPTLQEALRDLDNMRATRAP